MLIAFPACPIRFSVSVSPLMTKPARVRMFMPNRISLVSTAPYPLREMLTRSRRSVQPRPDPRLQLVLPNPEHASRRLDLRPDAPPGDECARQRRIGEIDRESVIQHASHS